MENKYSAIIHLNISSASFSPVISSYICDIAFIIVPKFMNILYFEGCLLVSLCITVWEVSCCHIFKHTELFFSYVQSIGELSKAFFISIIVFFISEFPFDCFFLKFSSLCLQCLQYNLFLHVVYFPIRALSILIIVFLRILNHFFKLHMTMDGTQTSYPSIMLSRIIILFRYIA